MNAERRSQPELPRAPERPPLLRSVANTYAANVAVAVLSFASVLITARALGAEGRGGVAFLTTIAFLTAQIANLGLMQANANLAAREPALTGSLAGTSLVLSGVFGLVAAGLLTLLLVLFPAIGAGSEPEQIALVLAAIPVLVLQPCLDQLLRAHYAVVLSNVAWVLMLFANVVINVVLLVFGALSVTSAVAAWIAGQTLGTLVLTGGVVRLLDGFRRFDAVLARRMLGFGLRAYGGRVMLLGNYRLDQWLLGGIAGPRELGHYSVAVAWVEALFFLPTALNQAQRPDLVRSSRRGAEQQAALAFRGTVLITFALAVAMVALAPFLCVTLFGESFRDSVELLRILTVGAFGIVALKLLGNALTAQRMPLLETAAIGAAFVLIVTLDVILIPSHGALGAAIASTAAYSVGGVAAAAIFTRALDGRLVDLVPRGGELAMVWRRLAAATRRAQG